MSNFRDQCAHEGLSPIECFESYVSNFQKALFMMDSPDGQLEADRISRLIIDYKQQIEREMDEQKAWHLFEEFRALS